LTFARFEQPGLPPRDFKREAFTRPDEGLASGLDLLRGRISTSIKIGFREAEAMSKPKDFETALQRLEEIVRKLDSGDLPLASLLEVYEEGVTLSRFCQTKLEEAERKVEILNKKADGTLERSPFDEPDPGPGSQD
jgi:exodeoxyribonuclease VII small subunit